MDKVKVDLLPDTFFPLPLLRELKICMSAESECYVPTAGVYRQSKMKTSAFWCSGETHNSQKLMLCYEVTELTDSVVEKQK